MTTSYTVKKAAYNRDKVKAYETALWHLLDITVEQFELEVQAVIDKANAAMAMDEEVDALQQLIDGLGEPVETLLELWDSQTHLLATAEHYGINPDELQR